MKKISLTILIAFLLSLLIHYFLFKNIDKQLKNQKLQFPTTNKKVTKKSGYTNVKYVKLLKPKKKEKPKEKESRKKEKIKKEIKKQAKEKTLTKKKKVEKKKPLVKKIKTIQLPQKPKVDLKKLFTMDKKQKEEKQKKVDDKQKKELEKQIEIQEIQKLDKITQQYIKLYGEQYFAYSKEQKKFIRNNINKIGNITQRYLVYPRVSIRTKQSGINIVEFILHPNGDITDLKITDTSYYSALDNNTIKTIKIAYKDYPRPTEPVKMKIYVKYILN